MARRVRIHADTYYVPTEDGVYLQGNHGPVVLRGSSISQWVDQLAPYLDGRFSVDELSRGLAPDRQKMIEDIVASLRSRGVARERREDVPNPLAAAETRRYAPEITFIDYFRDSAAAAFAHYRFLRALVVGGGTLLPTVARAALRSGLRTVHAVTSSDELTGRTQLAAVLEEARRRDPDQRLVHVRLAEVTDEGLERLLRQADLVLYAADVRPDVMSAVQRGCARAGVPLGQVVLGDGEVWLVPVGSDTPGWSAAQPRLRPVASEGTDHPRARVGDPAAAAAAARLMQDAFRVVAGTAEPGDPERLTRIDVETLDAEEHRFLAHPFTLPVRADTEAEFGERMAELAKGEPLTGEEFSRRAARCVDSRFGIVTLHEHDWAQSPLHVTEARAYPVGLPGSDDWVRVVGAAFAYDEARSAAAMRGLMRYAGLTVDPRRLVDASGSPLVSPTEDPSAALAALRNGTLAAAVWGRGLVEPRDVRPVPCTLVYPWLRSTATQDRPPAGLGAGLDWETAVLSGLLGHCHRRTLEVVARATTAYPLVDLTAVALDEAGTRCRDLLATLDKLPNVYEIRGTAGVPTYAFCSGPDTIAYATEASPTSALTAGLTQVLRAVQASAHEQPPLAPATAPTLPQHLRGGPGKVIAMSESQLWDTPTLAARLHQAGLTTLVAPLDHDPRLAQIMPYLVHVVTHHE